MRTFLTLLDNATILGNHAALKEFVAAITSLLGEFNTMILLMECGEYQGPHHPRVNEVQLEIVPLSQLDTPDDCSIAIEAILEVENRNKQSILQDLTIGINESMHALGLFLIMMISFMYETDNVILLSMNSKGIPKSIKRLQSIYAMTRLHGSVKKMPESIIGGDLARSLRRLYSSLPEHPLSESVSIIADRLNELSYVSKLPFPLEFMENARTAADMIHDLPMSGLPLMVKNDLIMMQENLAAFGNVDSSLLTINSIKAQLTISKMLYSCGMVGCTLSLLSEIMINYVILSQNEENWLGLANRQRVSKMLQDFVLLNRNHQARNLLTSHLREFLGFWDTLHQTREFISKCGFSHTKLDAESIQSIAIETISYIDDLITNYFRSDGPSNEKEKRARCRRASG